MQISIKGSNDPVPSISTYPLPQDESNSLVPHANSLDGVAITY